ncbi:alpha-hydroxy acid oxidase [Embleya sp. NPDC001921]
MTVSASRSTMKDKTNARTRLNLRDVEDAAAEVLPHSVLDFVAGGSGSESTLSSNRRALDRLDIVPRVLTGTDGCDMTTRLLGTEMSMPVAVAPMAYQRLLHPRGECAVALACRAEGVIDIVSMLSSVPMSEYTAVGARTWYQAYWLRDRGRLLDLVAEAEDRGSTAVVLTVDMPRMARRLRDMRGGFALPENVHAVDLAGSGTDDTAHRRATSASAVMTHTAELLDPRLGWSDIAWLRSHTSLPLVLKGILHPLDAERACDAGVDALVVSNHGGRQLDNAIPSAAALAAVCHAVRDRCPVLFDSGVRSGTDILKALALGASAVLVGRPILWGLAVDGESGVREVLSILRGELEEAMVLSGCPDLAAVRKMTLR